MSVHRFGFAAALITLVFFIASPGFRPVQAAVSTVGDGSPGSCTEAAFDSVFFALPPAGGTIHFNCGTAPVTILFTTRKNVSVHTVLEGAGKITLSGSNSTGIFQVFNNQALTLNQITLTRALSSSGAIENFGLLTINESHILHNTSTGSGGGIFNQGVLVVNNSVLSGNSASDRGGGIHLDGESASVTNTRFENNIAATGGGGISAASGSLRVEGSSFSGNQATDVFAQGGGLLISGTADAQVKTSDFSTNRSSRGGAVSILGGALSISEAELRGNWGAYGGGIRQEGGTLSLDRSILEGNGYSPTGTRVSTGGGAISWGSGTADIRNVTILNNWASYGGGFDHSDGTTILINVTMSGNQAVGAGAFDLGAGSVTLINSTIIENSAQFFSGGIGNRGGLLTIKNTLLANNVNPQTGALWNCYKEVGTTPFVLSNDFTCRFGQGRDGVDLKLGPMVSVNAYTQVVKPEQDSPAIDTGSGADCPPVDQRGVVRPQGAACDIGAVEVTAEDLLYRVFLPVTMR